MTGMKKTHWLRNTLIVLAACGLAGIVLAAVLFHAEENRTYAASSILFSFDGADEGKAPNGYRFDMSGLVSDEVLNAALETSGLAETYTAEQLRENLSVTGVYPEKIAEQMTKYVSLMDSESDSQAAVLDFHATQYDIELYNDFDRGISSDRLSGLLKEILSSYRIYFTKTYAASLETSDPITNLSEYDYAQQLEAIGETVSQQRRYAEEMAAKAPNFMLAQKGFGDIAVRYRSLESDIDRLNAMVTLNTISRDRNRLQKRYEMEIRTQQGRLESLTEQLERIEELVNAYDKDGLIYISVNGTLNTVGSNESGTYDKMVARHREVTDRIAETNAKIALYQGRLEDLAGTESDSGNGEGNETNSAIPEGVNEEEPEELKAEVEQKIDALTVKKNDIANDFTAMLNAYSAKEINERTVYVAAVEKKSPSLFSGKFAVKAVKTAGPLCATGFMVCLALLIVSRRKEEKAKA